MILFCKSTGKTWLLIFHILMIIYMNKYTIQYTNSKITPFSTALFSTLISHNTVPTLSRVWICTELQTVFGVLMTKCYFRGFLPPRVIYYVIILTTFSLACISRNFLLASTWMCELTCFRVLVFPVRSLMYLAISSFRPATGKNKKLS
jgi:hypothetical protein